MGKTGNIGVKPSHRVWVTTTKQEKLSGWRHNHGGLQGCSTRRQLHQSKQEHRDQQGIQLLPQPKLFQQSQSQQWSVGATIVLRVSWESTPANLDSHRGNPKNGTSPIESSRMSPSPWVFPALPLSA